jgi:uncharacterized protein YeaO (DUF488 family)
VRKSAYASRDYFDVWLPELAPSAKLVGWALSQPFTPERWRRYVKAYRREMQSPQCQRILEMLARLSHQSDFAVGCYCEVEARCHRSILVELLAEHGAKIAGARKGSAAAPKRGPRSSHASGFTAAKARNGLASAGRRG